LFRKYVFINHKLYNIPIIVNDDKTRNEKHFERTRICPGRERVGWDDLLTLGDAKRWDSKLPDFDHKTLFNKKKHHYFSHTF
jgi:hypothetical protein